MGAPWFKLFPKEFLADSKVKRLSREHRSILLDLWCFCAMDGSIPDDVEALSRLLGESVQTTKKALEKLRTFFVQDGESLYSTRLREESEAYARRVAKNPTNGAKGGRPKKPNKNPLGFQNETHPEPVGDPKRKAEENPNPLEAEAEAEKDMPSSLRSEGKQAIRPTQADVLPWIQDELQALGVTSAQAQGLAQQLGPRLPAALFKIREKKSTSNPAGLLVRKAAELAEEGAALLQGQVDRAAALAPKGSLLDPRWQALPESLRLDLEAQALWLGWRVADDHVRRAQEGGRIEAMAQASAIERNLVDLLLQRHPDRDGIKARIETVLGAHAKSETARRRAVMAEMGLGLNVPAELRVMPLAVGER